MKVKIILHKLLEDVTPNMHKVRRKSLNALVTSLGRHIKSQTTGINGIESVG